MIGDGSRVMSIVFKEKHNIRTMTYLCNDSSIAINEKLILRLEKKRSISIMINNGDGIQWTTLHNIYNKKHDSVMLRARA